MLLITRKHSSNATHVTCYCNHLTNFAASFKKSLESFTDAGYAFEKDNTITSNNMCRDKIRDSPNTLPFLIKRPAPIIFVACVFTIYIVAMIYVLHYDARRDVSKNLILFH